MRELEFRNLLKKGHPEAFSQLFRETYPRMLGYCRLFIKDSKQSEDLVQDCFEKLWEKRSTINPEKSVESLLFVMLRNKCLNVLKEQPIFQSLSVPENLPANELQYLYQLDFTEKEEKSVEERLIVSLKAAIDELPDKRKEAFIKSKIEGKKQKDIAEEMGISVKAVEKHISQAKEQLRKKLEKEYASLAILLVMLLQ